MDNIIVLNQNVKLPSLLCLSEIVKPDSETMILSTQFIFENEAEQINRLLDCNCVYKCFADVLSDTECEACDKDAFCSEKQGQDVTKYYEDIQYLKNRRLLDKLLSDYSFENRLIVADGLGIRVDVWKEYGFVYRELEYYYEKPAPKVKKDSFIKRMARPFYTFLFNCINWMSKEISVAYKDGVKYLFYGSLNRISYRIDLNFKPASKVENIKYFLNKIGIVWKSNTIRLSSFHEGYHTIPDYKELNVKLIQDGYLPPNYSSNYLYFYGRHTEFYAWDDIGCNTFRYHKLPYKIMPIRKKLFLPAEFQFSDKVKKVLCASSGTGDWTAIKNRSDDDRLVWAMGKVAAMFPKIEFIYRCHPTWIHPQHAGVNSINRCAEYISWLNLPNFKISCNIPNANKDGKFILSYKRSSLEEDLKGVDLVFGEHSVAMLDAGFKGIPFASCNLTGHRAYFEDISKLGFPHCESVEEMAALIKNLTSDVVKDQYRKAIANYNKMTEIE